jgi:hypothetical protein
MSLKEIRFAEATTFVLLSNAYESLARLAKATEDSRMHVQFFLNVISVLRFVPPSLAAARSGKAQAHEPRCFLDDHKYLMNRHSEYEVKD